MAAAAGGDPFGNSYPAGISSIQNISGQETAIVNLLNGAVNFLNGNPAVLNNPGSLSEVDTTSATVRAVMTLGGPGVLKTPTIKLLSDSPDGTTFPLATIQCNAKVTGPAFIAYPGSGAGQVSVTVNAPGSGTIPIPAGVTTVLAECWGPAQGGANGNPVLGNGGASGGGGEYAAEPALAVTGGGTVAYSVGSGGAGGAGSGTVSNPGAAGSGVTTLTGSSATVTANPGSGPAGNNGGIGSMNTVHFRGGNGPSGVGGGNGGSGGGSSGGTSLPGNSGSQSNSNNGGAGGAAVPGGGAGGNGGKGGSTNPAAGQNGAGPGGGGGGGGFNPVSGFGFKGGNGANGQVRVTYTPSSIVPVASISGAALTDDNGNKIPLGLGLFNQGVTPAAPTLAALLYGAAGQPAYVNPAGLQMGLSGAQLADFTNFTVTGITLADITKAWSIPANDMIVGAIYELTVSGNGTTPTTATTLQFGGLVGATAGSAGTFGATMFPAAADAFRFKVVYTIKISVIGSSGTFSNDLDATVSLFGNWVPGSPANFTGSGTVSETSALAVNTTIASVFKIQAAWGSTTGGPTLTARRSTFKRIA